MTHKGGLIKMKKFFKEFRDFAVKGNMMDLAVGMIVGTAFTGIVKSLVDDIFMPVISIFTGKQAAIHSTCFSQKISLFE